MDTLIESGLPDLSGTLLRTFVETWSVGMLLTFEGEAFAEELRSDFNFGVGKLHADNPGFAQDAIDWHGETSINVRDVVDRLHGHMSRAGLDPSGTVLKNYSLVYRATSGGDAHGGFAAVVGHLGPTPADPITPDRRDLSARGGLLYAGALLPVLAGRVFELFGLGLAELEAVGARLDAVRLKHATDTEDWLDD